MNDTLNIAKGITGSEYPLTVFLVALFLVIAIATWRMVKAVGPYLDKVYEGWSKRNEAEVEALRQIPIAITNLEKGMLGVESRLDKRIDDTRDELVDRISRSEKEIIHTIRDEEIESLKAEIRRSNADLAAERDKPPTTNRGSR